MNKTIAAVVITAAALVLTACGTSAPSVPTLNPTTASASTSLSPSQAAPPTTVTAAPPVTVTAAPPPAPVTVTATPPPAPVTVTQAAAGNPFPNVLPGALCSDLQYIDFTYDQAYAYWVYWGRPSNMDIDGNGIPCQTVYPDAPGYTGTTQPAPATDSTSRYPAGGCGMQNPMCDPMRDLPQGLLCRDLRDQGFSYSEAVRYWNYWGHPDNMDIDLNGIPCETVWAPNER